MNALSRVRAFWRTPVSRMHPLARWCLVAPFGIAISLGMSWVAEPTADGLLLGTLFGAAAMVTLGGLAAHPTIGNAILRRPVAAHMLPCFAVAFAIILLVELIRLADPAAARRSVAMVAWVMGILGCAFFTLGMVDPPSSEESPEPTTHDDDTQADLGEHGYTVDRNIF